MSFPKNDRKLQSKTAKAFPVAQVQHLSPESFVAAIADALQKDFGREVAAIKTVARLTDSNERAVRNWFEGKNGPNGENLVALMHHSDQVLKTVLGLAGRSEVLVTHELDGLCEYMAGVIATIRASRLTR